MSERQAGVIKSVDGHQVSVRRADGGEFQVDIRAFGRPPMPRVGDPVSYIVEPGAGSASVDADWRTGA